ncbi:MAG: 50S ribosome-binding GTPase [Coprobacillus sp.]|nr:50S ribosome-binding GTPase [Coprobacillus sp.]
MKSSEPIQYGILLLDINDFHQRDFLFEMCSCFFYFPLQVIVTSEEDESEKAPIDETYYFDSDKFFELVDDIDELVESSAEEGEYTLILPMDLTKKQRETFYHYFKIPFIEYSDLVTNFISLNAKSEMSKTIVTQLFVELDLGDADLRAESTRSANSEIRRRKSYLKSSSKVLSSLVEERDKKVSKYYDSRCPIVSLVGYPNAGKSTLYNKLLTRLTGAGTKRESFTLEPKYKLIKNYRYPNFYLMNGTGLIYNNPDLFMRNLSPYYNEYGHADLVIDIVDTTNPDYLDLIKYTEEFLESKKVNPKQKVIHLLSKSDLENANLNKIPRENELLISLENDDDIDLILDFIFSSLTSEWIPAHLFLPYEINKESVYKHAYVREINEKENGYEVTASINPIYLHLYKDYIV